MKKLFHPGIIALLVIAISSCSKSAGDMVAVEQENAINPKNAGMSPGNQLNNPIITSQLSQFYRSIVQPFPLEIGDNGATINVDQIAGFFVTLSPDVANQIPVSATLTTYDDATGDAIETYRLISYMDIGTIDAIVPEDLVGTPFMVALVYLGNQYLDKTITLTSEIEFTNAYSPARLDRAFTVIQ